MVSGADRFHYGTFWKKISSAHHLIFYKLSFRILSNLPPMRVNPIRRVAFFFAQISGVF